MGMYGNDYDYANSRLEGTIVRLEGKPVFITNVTRGMKANVSYLTSIDDLFKVDVDDLDLKPVPLGYCNKDGTTTYLMRMPMRKDWRQGTRIANMCSRGHFRPYHLRYSDLEPVITGKYPTLKQALEFVLKKAGSSMAWSREWAVGFGNVLYYKSEPVGSIVEGKPTLEETNNYLSQSLEEVL